MMPFLEGDNQFYNKLKIAQEKLNFFLKEYSVTFGLEDYQYILLKAKEKIPVSKNQKKNLDKFWKETKEHLYKIDVYGSLAFK